jgi:hypothetical protein
MFFSICDRCHRYNSLLMRVTHRCPSWVFNDVLIITIINHKKYSASFYLWTYSNILLSVDLFSLHRKCNIVSFIKDISLIVMISSNCKLRSWTKLTSNGWCLLWNLNIPATNCSVETKLRFFRWVWYSLYIWLRTVNAFYTHIIVTNVRFIFLDCKPWSLPKVRS